ncbi:MAG: thiamine pyrophosphate-dependent enzyme [Bacteroidales bacterium]|nr:thiamine pyrophosphate-dependent enzyme [Bacteroidales bacterium]
MKKALLLGDEAIAQAALDAGISGVYAYPGTPSTEITAYIQNSEQAKEGKVHSIWSVNEKTSMETAIGMSYAGKRALCCMKHVGLNVAMDPFVNSAITGANGGLVYLVADDPSMHSSQDEQDSRALAKFAFIPCFEPSSQQEAYDMIFEAFDLSEKMQIPVMMRITTRLAHSRAGVARREPRKQNEIKLHPNPKQFILLPAIARKQYNELLDKQPALEAASENSKYNQYIDGSDKSLGIIACGLAYNYLMENYQDEACKHPILKVSQYPLPRKAIEKITKECKEVLIIEDGYPVYEELLRGYLNQGLKVKGRLDGTLPRVGELNPNLVAKALGMPATKGEDVPALVVPRPPSLCKGCSHIDMYKALNEVMEKHGKGKVYADIGCYTLGALPPYNAIYTTLDMGAAVTMAKGAADAGLLPAVCVIGDSTFTHSGMTGLLDCVIEKTPITIIIADNSTTGMTGGQISHAYGRLEQICEGLGVEKEHIRVCTPLPKNHEELVKIIEEEIAYPGVSVVIPRRECIQTVGRPKTYN